MLPPHRHRRSYNLVLRKHRCRASDFVRNGDSHIQIAANLDSGPDRSPPKTLRHRLRVRTLLILHAIHSIKRPPRNPGLSAPKRRRSIHKFDDHPSLFIESDTIRQQLGRPTKINLKKVSYFSPRKNTMLLHHVYHALHHMFTTKTPQQKCVFRKNPLQKP
jgi:hypothetical protein